MAKRDAILTRPRAIENLRFTPHGVYADYLVSGVPYALRRRRAQNQVARLHGDFLDAMPSGFWLQGLTAATRTEDSLRRMLARHRDLSDWVEECVQWEDVFDTEPAAERLYWLSVPVDHGSEGRTALGRSQKAWDWIKGRDVDAAGSVAEYIEQGNEFVSAIPSTFGIFPVTPDLVQWHWLYTAGRGGQRLPLPEADSGRTRLEPGELPRIRLDEGDQAAHGRRFPPSRWPGVRVSVDGFADSYQTALTLTEFSQLGMRFPGSEIFQVVDDERLLDERGHPTVTADWVQYCTKTPLEAAKREHAWIEKNLKDQQNQQGTQAEIDPELQMQREDVRQLSGELQLSQRDWRVNMAAVVIVSGPSRRAVDGAVKTLKRNYTDLGIRVDDWSGPQAALVASGLPGNVHPRVIEQLTQPTTRESWSRTVPLTSAEVGNSTGTAFGRNIGSALSQRVFIDLGGASKRGHSGVIVFGGDPGGGKSHGAKRVAKGEILRGAQGVFLDPGVEWHKAFKDFPGVVVYDLDNPGISLDILRLFPAKRAGTVAADHILSLLRIDPQSQDGARFRLAVSEKSRIAHRITTMNDLIDHLALTYGDGNSLVVGLRSWQSEPLLDSVFNPALPAANIADARVVIWKTGALDLQEVDDTGPMTTTQVAGQMLYGLAAALAEETFYSRPWQFGFLVTEEDRQWLATRGGRRTAHLITRRGRRTRCGWISITQNGPDDHQGMGDEFIRQKVITRTENEDLASRMLAWGGISPKQYPEVVEDLRERTSPPDLRRSAASLYGFDDDVDDHGRPIPGREGEAYYVDEFGRVAKIQIFPEASETDRQAFDTSPISIGEFERQQAEGIYA